MRAGALAGAWTRRGIQTRVMVLVGAGMLASLVVFGEASRASVDTLTRQLLTERQALASGVADHLEYVMQDNLELLQAVASAPHVELADQDLGPERAALTTAYLHSHLFEAVFLLDEAGRLLAEEPRRTSRPYEAFAELPAVRDALGGGRPTASSLIVTSSQVRRLYLFVALRDWRGRVVGLVGGEVDPQSARFTSLLQRFRLGRTASADLVDRDGVVIATTDPSRRFIRSDHGHVMGDLIRSRRSVVETCHGCHGASNADGRVQEIMAFAPLSVVTWGVNIRQPEAEVLASAVALRRRFFRAGSLLFLVALLFAWGAARSVRRPLAMLTQAAERIAAGEMDQSIPPLGEDEVGRLGRSLESMRMALTQSIEEVARTNAALEQRVEERTRELARLYEELRARDEWRRQLLRKVISVQEEERKRIARELHDETSQTLSALAMSLETVAAAAPSAASRDRLAEVKALTLRALDALHRLIFDLRPSVLDDLGLLSAVRWFAERTLHPLGVNVRCDLAGLDRRLPPEVETALFRVIQEAVTNVARHAEADRVLIQSLRRAGSLVIDIEDDGKGFDMAGAEKPVDSARGLGLLGMRERMELLGGSIEVDSAPGRGTRVVLRLPLPADAETSDG